MKWICNIVNLLCGFIIFITASPEKVGLAGTIIIAICISVIAIINYIDGRLRK